MVRLPSVPTDSIFSKLQSKKNIPWYVLIYYHNSWTIPDSKVHGPNMGPIWGRQDPGGPNVGPMNFAIWDTIHGIMLNGKCNIGPIPLQINHWVYISGNILCKTQYEICYLPTYGFLAGWQWDTHVPKRLIIEYNVFSWVIRQWLRFLKNQLD